MPAPSRPRVAPEDPRPVRTDRPLARPERLPVLALEPPVWVVADGAKAAVPTGPGAVPHTSQ
ncbi:hypothetical protein [Nocardia yamanashiensis]